MGRLRPPNISVPVDSCRSIHQIPQKSHYTVSLSTITPLFSLLVFSLKKRKSKYSATRRLLLKTKLLRKAESLLVKEKEQKDVERENALREKAPPLKLSGLSVQELQELCKDLHEKIDIVDEARYDLAIKVARNDAEIVSLTQRVYELKGKMKRPKLKRVKKSAGAMLGALTDNRIMKADFKANLKTVKKEEEKKEEVTDWRKNVEAMSGMEGRKKLFNAGQ
ncbi:troponin I4a [Paramisgurnus dabryanus]|uniref:troponin I4a n=1 Tax=Paramisgurnus dabryanus TaxID=90735 RepID=UPI003CCF2213